jgi:hypothetical protein
MTTSIQQQRDRDKTLMHYEENLLTGRAFQLHAESARSRFGYMPPITRRDWAHAQEWIAALARHSDATAQIAHEATGINLYGDASQASAAIFEGAARAFSNGYTDVILRASPEPGRYSDQHRRFTLAEAIRAMAHLQQADRAFSPSAGYGWALQALADRENVRLPEWETGFYGTPGRPR